MKKYTVDVRVVYVQTIEVIAANFNEAEIAAGDRFEVNDATQIAKHTRAVHREDLPATEGENDANK